MTQCKYQRELRLNVELTSVELWSVVVSWVSHLTEEGGQVPADRYREHQCHADPEWAYTHTHTHTHISINEDFHRLLSSPNFDYFPF